MPPFNLASPTVDVAVANFWMDLTYERSFNQVKDDRTKIQHQHKGQKGEAQSRGIAERCLYRLPGNVSEHPHHRAFQETDELAREAIMRGGILRCDWPEIVVFVRIAAQNRQSDIKNNSQYEKYHQHRLAAPAIGLTGGAEVCGDFCRQREPELQHHQAKCQHPQTGEEFQDLFKS